MNKDKPQSQPPALIGGQDFTKIDIPSLMENLMSSEKYKYVLTDLSPVEIKLLPRLYAYCERYKLTSLIPALDNELLMKVSNRRLGRKETIDALKLGSNADRTVKTSESIEKSNRGTRL